jgi:hypothetical protein
MAYAHEILLCLHTCILLKHGRNVRAWNITVIGNDVEVVVTYFNVQLQHTHRNRKTLTKNPQSRQPPQGRNLNPGKTTVNFSLSMPLR